MYHDVYIYICKEAIILFFTGYHLKGGALMITPGYCHQEKVLQTLAVGVFYCFVHGYIYCIYINKHICTVYIYMFIHTSVD